MPGSKVEILYARHAVGQLQRLIVPDRREGEEFSCAGEMLVSSLRGNPRHPTNISPKRRRRTTCSHIKASRRQRAECLADPQLAQHLLIVLPECRRRMVDARATVSKCKGRKRHAEAAFDPAVAIMAM